MHVHQLAHTEGRALRLRLVRARAAIVPLIDRHRGQLKKRPLSLTPVSLERDEHATRLIRLLSLGLRGLMRVECLVRRGLAVERNVRVGLYAKQPMRAPTRPTVERLLEIYQSATWRAGR